MLNTRRVYDYKGHRVYLRHLQDNLFEYVIPIGKDLFEKSFKIKYAPRKKQFTEKESKEIEDMMRDVANNFIDTYIYQHSLAAKVDKLIFHIIKFWQNRKIFRKK